MYLVDDIRDELVVKAAVAESTFDFLKPGIRSVVWRWGGGGGGGHLFEYLVAHYF